MAGAEQFLIDKSAHARILRPVCRGQWADVLLSGRVSLCAPSEVEILYSARSVEDYGRIKRLLADVYGWVAVPDSAWQRLLSIQERLVKNGQHRSAGIPDLLVAVTALHHGLTVLHYDRDFETIAKHTELKTRWLAEPGSLD
ncbi:PIN domain nuclease [Kitasatospora sp. NPDC004723]|uniref:PIN domain nuclease n=1 Tax=Kitasatospora sp. NPDC004723 TaxID=3154288 RepID=UPI0033B68223